MTPDQFAVIRARLNGPDAFLATHDVVALINEIDRLRAALTEIESAATGMHVRSIARAALGSAP